MKDEQKTREQLLRELVEMRQRIAQLEALETERKQVEDRLRESEARYRTLFADSQRQAQELALLNQVRTALAGELDLPVLFRTVVEAIADTFGYTLVSLYLLQDDVLVLQHQVGYDQVIEEIPITQGITGRVVRTGQPVLLEDVRTDAAFLGAIEGIVSEVCVPLFDQGRPVGVLNVESSEGIALGEVDLRLMTALSEHISVAIGRARLYAEVQESEDRYADLYDNAPDMYFTVRRDGTIISVNRLGAEMLGYQKEELIGKPVAIVFHPEDVASVQRQIDEILRSREGISELEFRKVRKDGSVMNVSERVSLQYDPQVEPILRILCRDITERKRAEEALRESESKLSSILSSMVDLVFAFDSEGRFTFCHSPSFEELYLPPDEFMGKKPSEVMPAHIHELFTEAFEKNRQGEVAGYEYELEIGGRAKWFSAKLSPVFLDGEFTGSVAVVRDITEHKRADEELEQRTAQLEALRWVGLEITADLDLDSLLHSIVSQAVELVGGYSGAIDLYRPDLDMLEWVVSVGFDQPPLTAFLYRGEGLCGKVWESGEPLIVEDYHHWEGRAAGWEGYPFQAVMGVPVRWGEEFLGVLEVSAAPPRAFSPADAELLGLFATQAAIAIRNARLYEEASSRADRLTVVNHISRAVGATLDLDDLMETVYREVTSVFEADAFFVALYDEEASELDFRLRVDEGIREAPERRPLGTGLTSLVVSEKKSLLIRDFEREKDHLPEAGLWGTMKATASWLGVPMLIGDRVVGVISVQAYRPHTYGQEEQLLLSTIADQVAVAVESSRLFQAEQEQRELAESLEEVTTALTATLDFDQVLECILEQVSRVVPNDAANIMLMEGDQARVVGCRGYERFGAEEFLSTAVFHIPEVPSLQQMLESRESVVITDTLAHSDWTRFSTLEWLRSYAAAPIIVRNEVIGFLNVDSGTPGFFTQADAEALRAFAGHAAAAIENARLYEVAQQEIAERKQAGEVLERRAAQLATLNHIGRHVASILDLQELLQRAVDAVQEDLDYLQAAVLLLDEDADDLYVAAATGNFWDIIPDDYRQPVGKGAIGIAAETGEAVLVKDASTDSRPYRAGEWFSPSSLSVPINIGGRVIGVLEVEADVTNAFDENDQAVLAIMADQVAIAIENARLFEEEKRRATQLALISEVGQKAASILDLASLIQEVVRSIQESFDYYNVALMLLDEDRRELTAAAVAGGFEHTPWEEFRQSIDEGIIGFVVRTGQSWLASDISKDPYYVPGFQGEVLTKSELTIPIRLDEEVIGVLDLQSIDLDDFDQSDVMAMEAVADRLAIAIENARLYQETLAHSRYLETLQQINATLRSTLPLSQVLETIAQGTGEALDYVGTLILVPDAAGERLIQGAVWGGKFLAAAAKLTGLEVSSFSLPLTAEENPMARAYLSGELQAWSRAPERIVVEVKPAIGPRLASVIARAMGAVGAACVPLSAGERRVGVLVALSPREQLSHEERAMLLGLADQAGLAIENARLYEAEQQRRRDAEALRETALALTSDLDRNRVVERILIQLQEVVPYDSASVQLLQGDMLVLIGGRGFPNLEEILGVSFPVDDDNPNREVMRTLSPCILEDAPVLYEAFTQEPFAAMGIRSWLGVPMLIGERTVGMITLDKCQPGFYTQEHARLAQAFAAQAAIAIENARLFEEVEKRRVYLEGVLGAAPDAIVTLSAHNRVVEWNPGAEKLFGYSREEAIGQNIDDLVTSADVLEEAAEFSQIVIDGDELPPVETVRYRKDGSPVHVIVAGSPIMGGDELIGAVAVYTDITARKRLEEQLAHMATHDILTGVPNRRGFFALGQQQLRIANRMNERMLLLFADFDGLKQINDTFGHSEGDQVLIEVANVLEEVFRESDIVARIAGDEFVVLAMETAEDSAEAITSRLRENLEARNAKADRRYELSLSVGIAHYDPVQPCSLDDLLARADRAMYEQKRCEQES